MRIKKKGMDSASGWREVRDQWTTSPMRLKKWSVGVVE